MPSRQRSPSSGSGISESRWQKEVAAARRAWVHEQTGIPVELHTSVTGMEASPDVVWAVLSEETEVEDIGPCTAEILNPPATALHIALNVAHHGRANAKTMADLARAFARVSPCDLACGGRARRAGGRASRVRCGSATRSTG